MRQAHRFAALACALATSLGAQIPGWFLTTGNGCPRSSLLYERFAAAAFDLANAPSLDFVPNTGRGYIVLRGTHSLLPTAGGVLVPVGDDTVAGPFALGFSFPHPGGNGSTTTVDVCSNGYVYLETGTITSSRCCDASDAILRAFRRDTPSWAVFGTDLDPSAGGSVWINTAPGIAWITWDQVWEGGTGQLVTAQIQFEASGAVSLVYGPALATTHSVLVGWSAGNGVIDSGPSDLSTLSGFDMGSSYGPLTISAPLARIPTVGSSFVVDITNVPGDALAAVLLLGTGQTTLPLDQFGLTGCSLLVTSDLPAFPTSIAPPIGTVTMPIAPGTRLVGLQLEAQAAVLSPTVNAGGVEVSNRGTIHIGNSGPVIVRAFGTDSQNADDQQPFWSVVNTSNLSIVSLRLDWRTAVPANTHYFDTDQTGMGDRFDGGNSTIPLCHGTYRQSTDITTGLDYTITPATPCGGTSHRGWIGSNFGLSAGDYRTLDFRFQSFGPGLSFLFDVDTDGGAGNGGAMAGLVVTVQMSDSTVRSGALVMIDPLTAQVIL